MPPSPRSLDAPAIPSGPLAATESRSGFQFSLTRRPAALDPPCISRGGHREFPLPVEEQGVPSRAKSPGRLFPSPSLTVEVALRTFRQSDCRSSPLPVPDRSSPSADVYVHHYRREAYDALLSQLLGDLLVVPCLSCIETVSTGLPPLPRDVDFLTFPRLTASPLPPFQMSFCVADESSRSFFPGPCDRDRSMTISDWREG